MLHVVPLNPENPADRVAASGEEALDLLRKAARPLEDARVRSSWSGRSHTRIRAGCGTWGSRTSTRTATRTCTCSRNLDGAGDTAVNAIRRPPDVSVRRLVDLHRDPETRRRMRTAGRERVHERSLPPREVEDQLRAMSKLL